MNQNSIEQKEPILTVTELNRSARELLESKFQTIWVEGEISNFSKPSSGHWYFSLKDSHAQIRCAMFRSANRNLTFLPKDGMLILARAQVTLYEPRGDFQLIINHLEESGFGALQRAFEKLKEKLFQEGLFDEKRKKPLPRFPEKIGIITSPSGAALQDILSVISRRFPALHLILYPTLVQGSEAAQQIVGAIETANRRNECDVLIVARGGGSLEDLWPFNEEIVARQIAASKIPIITGIGHEIDFTIADFAADRRAPTPSAAAELIVPNRAELAKHLSLYLRKIGFAIKHHAQKERGRLELLMRRLHHESPISKLQQQIQSLDRLQEQLKQQIQKHFEKPKNRLTLLSHALAQASPFSILARGYAIITSIDGKIVQNSKKVHKGDLVQAKLQTGSLTCTVDQVD